MQILDITEFKERLKTVRRHVDTEERFCLLQHRNHLGTELSAYFLCCHASGEPDGRLKRKRCRDLLVD